MSRFKVKNCKLDSFTYLPSVILIAADIIIASSRSTFLPKEYFYSF